MLDFYLNGKQDLTEFFVCPGCVIALAAKLLSVDALTEIAHLSGVVVRIGYRDVGAGIGKVLKQMLHVGHCSLSRQPLNNMVGRLSDDPPVIAAAFGLGPKCSCRFAKGIRRDRLGGSKRCCQVARVLGTPILITVGFMGILPHGPYRRLALNF